LDIQAFAAHLGNDSAQQDADGHVTNLPGSEKVLAGAHLGWSVSPKLKAAAVYVYRSAEAIGEDRHTAGLFATGQAGPLTLTGEGYAQLGDLAHNSISAWMAAGRVTYKSTLPGALGVGLFGEALSGDRTKEGAFDTLYGTNHKFYGEMDFFLDIPKHTALHGLVDAGASLSALPSPWLTCNLDAHLSRPRDAQQHQQRIGPGNRRESHCGDPQEPVCPSAVWRVPAGRGAQGHPRPQDRRGDRADAVCDRRRDVLSQAGRAAGAKQGPRARRPTHGDRA
jgi:hypothetical protein